MRFVCRSAALLFALTILAACGRGASDDDGGASPGSQGSADAAARDGSSGARLQVVADSDGTPIAEYLWAALDGSRGLVAQGRSPFRPADVPPNATTLLVHARDAHLAEVPVADAVAGATVRASAPQATATVRVEGPAAAGFDLRVRRVVAWDRFAAGSATGAVALDAFNRSVQSAIPGGAPAELRVPIPDGLETSVVAQPTGILAWPLWQVLRSGGTHTLRTEPLRSVRVRGLAPVPAGTPVAALVIPDRLRTPDGPAARVEALDVLVGSIACGGAVLRSGEVLFERVPPVVCHVHLRVGRTPYWATWDGTSDELAVAAEPALLRVTQPPLLGGRPLPEGGIIAPGRRDVVAVAALTRPTASAVAGTFHRRGPGAWVPVELPAAPEYTLWHPQVGVAHVTPGADGSLVGTPCAGRIRFRSSDGGALRGSVIVWPCWPGEGVSYTRPPEAGPARTLDPSGVVGGLPAGTYRVDHALSSASSGAPAKIRQATVVVASDGDDATIVVPSGR